jgi:hypothetical protein
MTLFMKGYPGDISEVINRAQLLVQARDKPFELILRIGDTLHTIKKD